MSTPDQTAVDEQIVERFQLKAFVEACLVLEEGVAGVRDIDMGLMLGAVENRGDAWAWALGALEKYYEGVDPSETMERIAQLTKQTRDETIVHKLPNGTKVNHTLGIASLGGATLDNEENYLIKKLLSGGLGVISIENQARI